MTIMNILFNYYIFLVFFNKILQIFHFFNKDFKSFHLINITFYYHLFQFYLLFLIVFNFLIYILDFFLSYY